jgi:hypothetical protein
MCFVWLSEWQQTRVGHGYDTARFVNDVSTGFSIAMRVPWLQLSLVWGWGSIGGDTSW